jgi:hypothetical protein
MMGAKGGGIHNKNDWRRKKNSSTRENELNASHFLSSGY